MSGLHASSRLGDLLVKKGKISHQQLFEAIRVQQERRAFNAQNGIASSVKDELGNILIELGFISRKQLRNCLSWQRRLRKATLVMTFFAPLFTAACGGGGSAGDSVKADVQTSSVKSSTYSSKAAVSSAISLSSSSTSSSAAASMIDGPVLINWSPPISRENGDYLDLADLGGYELRYKLKNSLHYKSIHIHNGYTDSYYFDYLKGDYEFEIAAYDSDGVYSDFVAIKRL